MHAAVVGGERKLVLGPVDGRVVELEPGHAENDWVVTKGRDVELDALGVRTDRELDRESFVGDNTGGNGASIGNLQSSWRCPETEADGMGTGKGGVDEGRNGTAVDQGGCLDRRTLGDEGDRGNEEIWGIGFAQRSCGCRAMLI